MKHSAYFSLAVTLMILLGCGKPPPVREGTLSIALNGSPTNIDPRYATDAYSQQIIDLCYNGLMKKDMQGRPVPDLAVSVTVTGTSTYRIRLRNGVHFHDGSELTAVDVISTYDFLRNERMGSPHLETFRIIQRMKNEGRYGLTIELKQPFAPFLTALTTPIVKAGTPTEALINRENGTGPFKMVTFSPDELGEFVPFDDYFEGRPALQKVRVKIIPDDNVRFLELKKGEVNFVINGVDPDLIDEIDKDENLVVEVATGSNFSYLGFNLNDPVLKHIKVREGIARGIHRKEIIEKILKGYGEEGNTLIAPIYWAHEKGVRTFNHDPAMARKLLDEAGFPDPDGDGPETRFKLTYKTSQNELRRRIAQVIQEQLRAIGIGVEITSYEWGTFFDDIKKRNFQIYSLTWVGITDPDIYYYAFHSTSVPPMGANRNGYANPLVDQLLEEGRVNLNMEKRKEAYSRVQKIISEEIPILGLWFNKNVLVRDKRVRGFVLQPDESFRPVKDVRIER